MEDSSWIRLVAANGIDMPCVGVLETSIEMQGKCYENICVIVVKDPTDSATLSRKSCVPGVLGCNLLQKVYSDAKTEDGSFIPNMQSELVAGLTSYQARVSFCERISAKVDNQESSKLGYVRLSCKNAKPMHIGVESVEVITGTTPNLPDGYSVCIEPADLTSIPYGLIVCSSVVKVKNNRVQFPVLNMCKSDIIIRQPHTIAEVYVADISLPDVQFKQYENECENVVEVSCVSEEVNGEDCDDSWMKEIEIDESLSKKQKEQFYSLLREYRDVFSKHDFDLGCTDLGMHKVNLTDDIPIKQPDRRIPPHLVPEVKKILQEWLNQGIISESESPFASQLVLVKKKCGAIRPCVDMRLLNAKTLSMHFLCRHLTKRLMR